MQGEVGAGGGSDPQEANRGSISQRAAAPLHPAALLDPPQT